MIFKKKKIYIFYIDYYAVDFLKQYCMALHPDNVLARNIKFDYQNT